MSSNAAVSRLSKEYRALLKKPIVGAAAAPLGDYNLFTWKAVVVSQAPYDFPVRIHLDYGEDYPNVAPKVYFETPIPFRFGYYTERHAVEHRGASYVAEGHPLQAVCLNIFNNFADFHDEWAREFGGWSPAYTIETILVSIQSLLMDRDFVSFKPNYVAHARRAAETFKCRRTGHSGAKKETWWPAVQMEREEIRNNNAAVVFVLDHLISAPTLDLPGGRVPDVTAMTLRFFFEAKKVKKYINLFVEAWSPEDETEYICYVTKECPTNLKLGFGVGVEGDGKRVKTFTSPCELLSLGAFTDSKVRSSSTNKKFHVWMPVMTPFQSWVDVRDAFYASVTTLVEMAGEPFDVDMSPIRVGASIMNNLVVEVMNAKNRLTMNDKFIDGYYAFMRLLLYHVHERPVAKAYVTTKVKDFIESPFGRSKTLTPNLGEFILFPLLTLGKFQWKDIADAFMRENDMRGVFWYAVGNYNNPAKYPELKRKGAPGRAAKVFDATEISRHLVCYQARFAAIAESMQVPLSDLTAMLPRYGGGAGGAMVPQESKAMLQTLYDEITAITNWDSHFQFLGLRPPGAAKRDTELVDALGKAFARGYCLRGRGGRVAVPETRPPTLDAFIDWKCIENAPRVYRGRHAQKARAAVIERDMQELPALEEDARNNTILHAADVELRQIIIGHIFSFPPPPRSPCTAVASSAGDWDYDDYESAVRILRGHRAIKRFLCEEQPLLEASVYQSGDVKCIRRYRAVARLALAGGGDVNKRRRQAQERQAQIFADHQPMLVKSMLAGVDHVLATAISCPWCKAPLLDFKGCCVLTCEACHREFCGVCCSQNPKHHPRGTTDGHSMVKSCTSRLTFEQRRVHDFSAYFVSTQGWELWKEKIKTDALYDYLRTLQRWEWVRRECFHHIEQNLRRGGGQLGEKYIAKLRSMVFFFPHSNQEGGQQRRRIGGERRKAL